MDRKTAGREMSYWTDERREAARDVAAEMHTLAFLVLDGRGGGPGFCAACDLVERLGLSDCDGHRTPLGNDVLTYAFATEEI